MLLANLPNIFGKFRSLQHWHSVVAGPRSIFNAYRLSRSGRHGGDALIDRAKPLRLRGSNLRLLARPGTDDLAVFREIFLLGEYRQARQLVRLPVRLVVDLGTNVGYSIAFFFTIFPEAHVIGVEPSRENLEMAKRNVTAISKSDRVVLHHGFIGATLRKAYIQRGGFGGSNELSLSDHAPDPSADTVPVITLSQLIEDNHVETIDLLKCDIEGGERELFADCTDWIHRVRNIVIELHGELDVKWLLDRLDANGAVFQLLREEHRHEGASLAWLCRAEGH